MYINFSNLYLPSMLCNVYKRPSVDHLHWGSKSAKVQCRSSPLGIQECKGPVQIISTGDPRMQRSSVDHLHWGSRNAFGIKNHNEILSKSFLSTLKTKRYQTVAVNRSRKSLFPKFIYRNNIIWKNYKMKIGKVAKGK